MPTSILLLFALVNPLAEIVISQVFLKLLRKLLSENKNVKSPTPI